jgi:hypothetical protein
MKRAFLEPGMEVIKFQDEDIITTSVIEDKFADSSGAQLQPYRR